MRPDTSGMDDLDRQLLENNPHWQALLQAYLELAAEAPTSPEDPHGPRWSDRIVSMQEVEPGELSAIHGQLIALGWLKFQFELGQTGLQYRVSSDGRALLLRLQGGTPIAAAEDNEREEDVAA